MVLFGNSGKNARLLGTALLIITFVAGGLAGAAVIRVLNAEGPQQVRRSPEGRGMRGGPRRLLLDEQFSKELGLTADQRTRIKTILDRRDAEARKMWETMEPRFHAFGKQVHDEIQSVLTVEQQKKLDAAIEKHRGERKRHCAPGDSAHLESRELKS